MNCIIWFIVVGAIGWIASMIAKTDAEQGIGLNIVVGVVGALLGGCLISPLLGAGTVNQGDFSLAGLIVSLIGAIILPAADPDAALGVAGGLARRRTRGRQASFVANWTTSPRAVS